MASRRREEPDIPADSEVGRIIASFGAAASVMVLLMLLLATLVVWQLERRKGQADLSRRFEAQAEAIEGAFRDRLEEYELVLQGARGLFGQGFPVGRPGWHTYVQGLHLDQVRPGIQGVGFAQALGPGEGPRLEKALRAGGLEGFKVWPPQESPHSAITLLEPLDARNRRALGFDMLSEPRRRAGLVTARDQGMTTLTERVTLVQEADRDVQAGFLMFLPVYRNGSVPPTVAGRRELLQGWVYSPFRMGDFSRAVLGSAWPDLRVEIFDGGEDADPGLLFDSHPGRNEPPLHSQLRQVILLGRGWTFRITSLPDFDQRQDHLTPTLLLAGGLMISLLIFGLLHGLVRFRQRAHHLARQMTAALREEQEHVRRILDSTFEGIYGLGLDGRCTFANEAYARIHGCEPADLVGLSIHAETHHQHPDGSPFPVEDCPIYQALKAGTYARIENEWFLRRDGTGYWANVAVAPIRVEGVLMGSVVTQEDVTTRKDLEQAKHDFVSIVSHELRTPLTSIRGSLGLLASGKLAGNPAETRHLVEIAQRNSERLGILVNDILDFEKIRSGQLTIAPEPLAVKDLLAEAVDANLPFATAFGVMLKVLPAPPGLTLRLDRKRMVQVLTNLLSNAIKFSPEGARVELSARLEGGFALLAVADRGCGISEAFRDRVFTPFSQAEAPNTRNHEGTGLGLTITKALVELMGGTLSFTSQEGVGTTFTIRLPEVRPS